MEGSKGYEAILGGDRGDFDVANLKFFLIHFGDLAGVRVFSYISSAEEVRFLILLVFRKLTSKKSNTNERKSKI
jgi:hypothetical protein